MILKGHYRTQKPNLGFSLDYGNPLTQNLTNFWAFNEGGGLALNSCMNNTNRAVISNPSAVTWSTGLHGRELNMADVGSTDYITFANNPAFGTTWTYETYLRLDGKAPAGQIAIAINQSTVAFILFNNVTSGVSAGISVSDGSTNITSNNTSQLGSGLGNWAHLVISCKAGFVSFYINGNSLALTTPQLTPLGSFSFDTFFSAQNFGDFGFIGKVSYIRIWQGRALSQNEAMQLYQAPFNYQGYKLPSLSEEDKIEKFVWDNPLVVAQILIDYGITLADLQAYKTEYVYLNGSL